MEHVAGVICILYTFTQLLTTLVIVDLASLIYYERAEENLKEQLLLFDEIVNSRWFQEARIYLVLNKRDIIEAHPLEYFFPDYHGGPLLRDVKDIILTRFLD